MSFRDTADLCVSGYESRVDCMYGSLRVGGEVQWNECTWLVLGRNAGHDFISLLGNAYAWVSRKVAGPTFQCSPLSTESIDERGVPYGYEDFQALLLTRTKVRFLSIFRPAATVHRYKRMLLLWELTANLLGSIRYPLSEDINRTIEIEHLSSISCCFFLTPCIE